MPGTIRARWKGHYAGYIMGQPIGDGDIYLIYPSEAFGSTTYTDPQTKAATLIGPGHVAKAEHAGLSKAQLEDLGYRFDEPSSNWEPLDPFVPGTFAQTALPAEVDLSEFYVPSAPPAPEATPELEASKDEEGRIEITTTLSPAPEPPAADSEPASEAGTQEVSE